MDYVGLKQSNDAADGSLRTYYLLTKPGIIFGNAMTTFAGFALASKGHMDGLLFFATFVGISCVIASAGIFNNAIDRDIDRKMERTKDRPLAKGTVSLKNALAFATLILLVGVLVLNAYTNLLTVSIALGGFFVYVGLYSFWKTRSVFATIVGSVSGASPPVVGYVAVSNQLDLGAALLFTILLFWQMPHFFAIAMYRFEEYAAAFIPILPIKKGMYRTKIHVVLYVIAYLLTALALTFFGYTGYTYAISTLLFGLGWLFLSMKGFQESNDKVWAKKMFFYSLLTITAWSLMLSVDALLN